MINPRYLWESPLTDIIAEQFLVEALDPDTAAKKFAKNTLGFLLKDPEIVNDLGMYPETGYDGVLTDEQRKWYTEGTYKLQNIGINILESDEIGIYATTVEDFESPMQDDESITDEQWELAPTMPPGAGASGGGSGNYVYFWFKAPNHWRAIRRMETGRMTVFSFNDALVGAIKYSIEQMIAYADPTGKKGIYIQWYLKHILATESDELFEMEDFYSNTREAMMLHHKYKHKLNEKWRDINQVSYTDFMGPIYRQVRQFSMQDVKVDATSDEYDVILDNESYSIVIPKTHRASCALGNGTDWCTAIKSNPSWFGRYTRQGPLYIITDKSNGERWQFHPESDQYMDEGDRSIDVQEFALNHIDLTSYPPLNRLFKTESIGSTHTKITFNHSRGMQNKVVVIINNSTRKLDSPSPKIPAKTTTNSYGHWIETEFLKNGKPIGGREPYRVRSRTAEEAEALRSSNSYAREFKAHDQYVTYEYRNHPEGIHRIMLSNPLGLDGDPVKKTITYTENLRFTGRETATYENELLRWVVFNPSDPPAGDREAGLAVQYLDYDHRGVLTVWIAEPNTTEPSPKYTHMTMEDFIAKHIVEPPGRPGLSPSIINADKIKWINN